MLTHFENISQKRNEVQFPFLVFILLQSEVELPLETASIARYCLSLLKTNSGTNLSSWFYKKKYKKNFFLSFFPIWPIWKVCKVQFSRSEIPSQSLKSI